MFSLRSAHVFARGLKVHGMNNVQYAVQVGMMASSYRKLLLLLESGRFLVNFRGIYNWTGTFVVVITSHPLP